MHRRVRTRCVCTADECAAGDGAQKILLFFQNKIKKRPDSTRGRVPLRNYRFRRLAAENLGSYFGDQIPLSVCANAQALITVADVGAGATVTSTAGGAVVAGVADLGEGTFNPVSGVR